MPPIANGTASPSFPPAATPDATTGSAPVVQTKVSPEVLHISARRAQDVQVELVKKEEEEEAEMAAEMEEGSYE